MELLQTIKRFVIWDTRNEVAWFKEELSKMAYFCCRYPLEFGREFGKLMYWNSPLAAKTRYAHVNGGADPRNTFLPLYFSSRTLAIAVFLPELPYVRKETLLLVLTPRILNRSCLEEVLEPEWDTTSLVLCLLPMAETTWFFNSSEA